MKGPALVLLAWGALLGVNTAVLIALGGDELPVLMLGGSAAGSALVGLALLARRRRREDERRAVPDLSPPAALAAASVAGLVLGAELGQWLILLSAGGLALALGGLLRELRRSRQA